MNDLAYVVAGWSGTAIAIVTYAARLRSRLVRIEVRTPHRRSS